MKKLLLTLFSIGALIINVNAQCPQGSQWFNPFDASTLTLSTRTSLTSGGATVWGNEYILINNIVAGNTYTFDGCGVSYDSEITLYNPSDVVVGYSQSDCAPDDGMISSFVAPVTGSYKLQLSQAGCGAIATNSDLFITLDAIGAPPCTDPDVPTITATPNSICPGASTTLDWAGANLNDATAWHVYTSSCGSGQLTSQTGTSLVVSPASTTTYYIRGEDGAGCVDESTGLCGQVTVTVSDAVNPTITCPGNQVGNVNASCVFTLPDYTSLATAADNCTASPTVTQSPVAGTNVGVGTTVITLTATDGSSNTANCNFNVVVSDVTNPTITCPGNQVGNVNASCVFSLPDYTSLATPADNCPGVVVTQVPAPGTNVGVGTTNIVLTATDGASNTANCNFDVVVSDNTNPTITCPGNQVGSVDASCVFSLPDYTSLATPADNCPGVVVTQVPAPGTNVGVGTTNIVLTATDGASNTANCNFDVVVSDNTNPTITCPGNQVGSVDASCVFSLPDYTSLATPADNCPGVVVTQVPAPGTNVGVGTTNIVLTATDGASNTANCNFDVVVSDNTNPTISCPGNQVGSVDASCVFSLPDYTSLATPADNCPGVVVTQVPAPGTNVGVGTTNIVLTATDGASNTANCNFDVVVSDNTNPTAVCQNVTVYLDGAGNATITAADIDGGSSDNCGAVTLGASQTAFTCADLGPNNVTLTATDGNSNTDNCVAVVTVVDTTSPTISCPGNQTGTPTTSCQFTLPDYTSLATPNDNCGSTTVTQSPTAGTAVGLGTTSITLTADDGNGNTSMCSFDVTVSSNITGSQTLVECDGFSMTIGSNTYNSTGIYSDTLVAANGCDSILTTDLTVLPALTGSVTNTICNTDSVVVNGTTYNAANPSGTEVFTNVGPNNCDSTVTVNLTVDPAIDVTITNTSPTLTANQTGATYQWVDCDNANAPIPTETSQSFTATVNGNYAVEITVGSCTETSACENVTGVGIKETIQNTVAIYPNPTTGIFTINLGNNANTINYSISSIEGRIIEQGKTSQNTITINLSDESKGIYFLKIENSTYKILKQ